MKKKEQYFNKYFLVILLTLISSYLFLCFKYLDRDYEIVLEKVKSESSTMLSYMDFFMRSSGSQYFANLVISTSQKALYDYLDEESSSAKAILISEWKSLMKGQRHSLMQLRILNNEGLELVRVDSSEEGEIFPVRDEELQDKSGRGYFKAMKKLDKGEVYISHLDLNIENGVIERPFKPTFRLGRVMENSRGDKFYFIVNYYWNEIAVNLKRMARVVSDGQAMVISADGHWISAPEERWEWSGILEERAFFCFSNIYPEAWKRIKKSRSGLFLSGKGVFTYTTLDIKNVLNLYLKLNLINDFNVDLPVNENRLLILIQHVPAEKIKEIFFMRNKDLIYFFTLCLILLFPAAFSIFRWAAGFLEDRKKLMLEAQYDDLTGLANRRKLNAELQSLCMERRTFSLFFIDLDDFKKINDLYGHESGDFVLKETALRLAGCTRKTDILARIGGDEMIAVLTGLDSYNETVRIAKNFLYKISQPSIVNGDEVRVGASIGIVMYNGENKKPKEVIRLADQAMYAAKNKGKNNYEFKNFSRSPAADS